ncbi:MAG: rhodanese-like domain-containing protein [Proteobacteria bacterium]|nr:rhodanese-like domain-containing protein [Pseudomonadota bacterium]
MKQLGPTQLKARLAAGDKLQLLDVREEWEFQTAHIEGSLLIPMGQVASRIAELDSTAETVVICHHGGRSMQVAGLLEQLGFPNVINLAGGVDAWARSVDPSMPVY